MDFSTEQLFAAALLGVVGLLIGSFLNVVAYRLPLGLSVVSPSRSFCPNCKSQLGASENIPLLSYLIQRGKCRHCGVAISAHYPLIELATGILYAATALNAGFSPELAPDLVFVTMLVAITATDLEHRIIPNKILIVAVALGIPLQAWARPDEWLQWMLAALIGFGAMLLIALIYPRGMGMGDVKLTGVMGLFLGRALGPAMAVAFIAGTVVGLALMARKGVQEGRKTAVAFGPFLAFGGLVGLFYGDSMLDWYLDFLSGG